MSIFPTANVYFSNFLIIQEGGKGTVVIWSNQWFQVDADAVVSSTISFC